MFGVSGWVWFLIVSIPDLCLILYYVFFLSRDVKQVVSLFIVFATHEIHISPSLDKTNVIVIPKYDYPLSVSALICFSFTKYRRWQCLSNGFGKFMHTLCI